MRVAYFHHSGDLYGASKSLLYLILELRTRGVEPLVILAEDGPFHGVLRDHGIRVELVTSVPVLRRGVFRSGVSLWYHGRAYFSSYARLREILRANRIDLLHSNDIIIGFLPGILSRLLHIPHVWHIRTNVSEFGGIARLAGWIMPRLADAIICISRTVLHQFGSRPDVRMKLVYNGLPPDIVGLRLPYNRDFRHNLGIAAGDTVVCCIGRINGWKGQTMLARAFAAIRDEMPPRTKLLFVGDVYPGNERYQDELDGLLIELGIAGSCLRLPFVTDVRSVYEAIDILVVPSVIPEPFGLVVVEGMAYGCPVVAANHGGPAEILRNGETGLLYEPDDLEGLADRIRELAADDGLRRELGDNARRFMEHAFSVGETADRVYEIYQACLTAGSRDSAGTGDW